jgi:hypothetical protein
MQDLEGDLGDPKGIGSGTIEEKPAPPDSVHYVSDQGDFEQHHVDIVLSVSKWPGTSTPKRNGIASPDPITAHP